MIPYGLFLLLGLGLTVNVYGELVVQALFGEVYLPALVVEHFLISWGMSVPLVLLLAVYRGLPPLLAGSVYGVAAWALVNSLLMPIVFDRLTPWSIGWSAIWPSLSVHMLYGVTVALAASLLAARSYPKNGRIPEARVASGSND